ncbi:MAG TPA: squalene/phytoene synthase family protein [Acidimicrobiales bacterium]|nr:squalene/phytoene synthase family protein [Acidimicrobiales bacterium]
MSLAQAYAHCEQVTRSEARNFAYGIRLLPPPQRRAMSAIYAMARRIDDIGDGDLPAADKLVALAGARKALADHPPPADDPLLIALHDAAARFPVPLDAFDELIEGCEMDAAGTVYGTFEELVGYCRRVAGSIGRLSLGVFGSDDLVRARPRADALGVALQLTNILRDLVALVVFEARRALPYWDEGLGLLPLLDWRSRACVAAMAGIYRRLLEGIQRRPETVLAGRLSLPTWEKAWVASRALAGVGA